MQSHQAYTVSRCLACDNPNHERYHLMAGFDLMRCIRCGFVFTRNIPSGEALEQYYRKKNNKHGSGQYQPKRNLLRTLKYRGFAAYLKGICRRRDRIRLLELGCSDGDLLEAVNGNARFTATGLDYTENSIAYCRSQGYDAIRSDLESACFPADEFDVVVALHVVEHFQDPVRSVSEIFRVLRPGGYFFAVVPCISHIKARLAGRRWKYLGPPGHLWYFTTRSLSKFVERIGFQTVYSSGLYHRAHARILAQKPVDAADATPVRAAA